MLKRLRNTFLLLSLAIFTFSAKAQLSHPHFIALNVGTNIPLGAYKELDSVALGNANPGIYYSVEAGAYFSKVIGLGVNIGVFSNSVNDKDIVNQLKREVKNVDNFTVESKDWTNSYLMVGPYFSFGVEAFIVDVKILGGLVNSAKPLINIESPTNQIALSRSNEVSSTSFGINYGIHFRIKLVGTLGLRLNAEGFMSKQEFDTKVQEVNNNGSVTQESQTIEKNIQALNLGAGLAFTF